MNKKEEDFMKFIQQCIDNDNVHGICSFKENEKISEQLKKDKIIS